MCVQSSNEWEDADIAIFQNTKIALPRQFYALLVQYKLVKKLSGEHKNSV